MTYYGLYEEANHLLNKSKITLGEYTKMVEPLNEEVRKEGEWTKNEHGFKCCSVCRKRPLQICYYDINYNGYTSKDILSKYCPNCGAKMERRADEK